MKDHWKAFWISVAAGSVVCLLFFPFQKGCNSDDATGNGQSVSHSGRIHLGEKAPRSPKEKVPICSPKLKTQEPSATVSPPSGAYEYKPPVFVGDSLYDRSFRIEVISAEQVDTSKLKFEALVRSQLPGVCSMGLVEPEKTAYLVDTHGNRYGFLEEHNLTGQFPSDVDVRGSMTFLAPKSTIKKINMVFQFRVGNGYPSAVIFRNLDLDTLRLAQPITKRAGGPDNYPRKP